MFSRRLLFTFCVMLMPSQLLGMSLFQQANLSQAARDALVVHFDATMGVSTVPGEVDVETWQGVDGHGAPVATATYVGPGAFGDLIWTGTSVRFAETTSFNNSRLQTTLPTSGNQFTVFWKGFYSSANINGAENDGLYAYNLTNLTVNNAPGINHQRDNYSEGFAVEVYPGITFTGSDTGQYDDTTTVWTTIYDYANDSHSAFANRTDLDLPGGSDFTLAADPTLIIGAYDDGSYHNQSGYNFLGDIEQLIIFDAVLGDADISAVEQYLGLSPENIKLSVDRQTGAVSLENNGPDPVSISGYSLSTPSGGFNRDTWTPIADSDPTWQIEGSPTDTTLAESTLGQETIAGGGSISLGSMNVWFPYFDETITATVLDGAGEPLDVLVEFGPLGSEPFEFGDVTFGGGAPDVDDWNYLQTVYGIDLAGMTKAEAYGVGDLNGDGIHSLADLQVFREAFGAAGGNAAELRLSTVPEPATAALAAIVLIAFATLRKSSSRRLAFSRAIHLVVVMGFLMATAQPAAAGLFDKVQLSADGRSKLLVHFDATVGVEAMGNQVDAWHGFDGTGQNVVATAVLDGIGSGSNITTNGTAVLFSETTSADTLHLQTALPTSGDQYTIFWRGHYDSANQNGAQAAGLYAYSLTNLDVNNAPSMSHQRDDFGGGYRIEVYPGTTYGGGDIAEYDDVATTWTTIYDYANGAHRAFANGKNLNLGGSSSLSLTANPTLIIGGSDDGRYFNQSGYSFLGEMEQLIVFEGILSSSDVSAIESFLGPSLPTLRVNTISGDITITGGDELVSLNGYEILSSSESLLPANWLIHNFDAKDLDPIGTADGENWDVFAATTTRLTEAYLLGGSPFDKERTASLGQAFNTSGTQDLTFSYQTTDGVTRFGVVEYITSLAGDFNSDGIVNLGDYLVWRNTLDATGDNLEADANGDKVVDMEDYAIWKSHYGLSSSAFSVSPAIGVPEPPYTMMLYLVAAFGVVILRAARGR